MSNGDPVGSELPRGKSNAARKGRYDGSYTGTEQRVKDELMKQFCRDEGPPPSSAYINAPCWCACGRLKVDGWGMCQRCADATPFGHHPTSESIPYAFGGGTVTLVSDPRVRPDQILCQRCALAGAGGASAETIKATQEDRDAP